MATILPFVKDGVFDQKDITAMSVALDDVCKILNLRDDSSAKEVIASRIVDLATEYSMRRIWRVTSTRTKFARLNARRGIGIRGGHG